VELGISLRELARRTGLPKGDLSRIESGRVNPTWEEIQKVTAALEGDLEGVSKVAGGTSHQEPSATPT